VRTAATRAPYVVEDVGESRRLEVDDDRRPGQRRGERGHGVVADRADVAEPLRDDHVRAQLAQQRFVEGIECAAARERLPHPAVGRGARQRVAVNRTVRDAWPSRDAGGEVAFVAHADQRVGAAERGHDLGRGREERDDAHAVL